MTIDIEFRPSSIMCDFHVRLISAPHFTANWNSHSDVEDLYFAQALSGINWARRPFIEEEEVGLSNIYPEESVNNETLLLMCSLIGIISYSLVFLLNRTFYR